MAAVAYRTTPRRQTNSRSVKSRTGYAVATKPARRFRSVENCMETVYSHGNCINIEHTEEYI